MYSSPTLFCSSFSSLFLLSFSFFLRHYSIYLSVFSSSLSFCLSATLLSSSFYLFTIFNIFFNLFNFSCNSFIVSIYPNLSAFFSSFNPSTAFPTSNLLQSIPAVSIFPQVYSLAITCYQWYINLSLIALVSDNGITIYYCGLVSSDYDLSLFSCCQF